MASKPPAGGDHELEKKETPREASSAPASETSVRPETRSHATCKLPLPALAQASVACCFRGVPSSKSCTTISVALDGQDRHRAENQSRKCVLLPLVSRGSEQDLEDSSSPDTEIVLPKPKFHRKGAFLLE